MRRSQLHPGSSISTLPVLRFLPYIWTIDMDRQARVKAPPGTFLHDGCITSCREPCASWELVHRAVGGHTSAICPQNHHHIIPDYSRPRSARYRIHICPLGVPFVWPLGGLCRQPRSPEPSPGGGLFCGYPPGYFHPVCRARLWCPGYRKPVVCSPRGAIHGSIGPIMPEMAYFLC